MNRIEMWLDKVYMYIFVKRKCFEWFLYKQMCDKVTS